MTAEELKRDLEVSAKYILDSIDRIPTIMAAGEFSPVRKVATAILEFSLWIDTLPVPPEPSHAEALVDEKPEKRPHAIHQPQKHKGAKHDDS